MTAREELVTLAECPIGLFVSSDGELCLKSDYGSGQGRIDAYIVASGEFFWGLPPQTIASQRAQMVQPVPSDLVSRFLTPLSAPAPDEVDRLREDCAQIYQVIGVMAHALGYWDDRMCDADKDRITKAMDNLSAASNGDARPHEDLLPFILAAAQAALVEWAQCRRTSTA